MLNIFKSIICAASIFFIPLFECLCCEDDAISSTCCAHQSTANQPCENHPCLDAIDELGLVEILEFSNFLLFPLGKPIGLATKPHSLRTQENFSPHTYLSKARRHLLMGVIIV